jgi:predicted ATPase
MKLSALPYIKEVSLKREEIKNAEEFPFSIPAVRELQSLTFASNVTFLVGENGSGKSTLLEAIAIASGFNAEGGSRNFNFQTQPSHSILHSFLCIAKSHKRPRDGFFLRAESFYNAATYIDDIGVNHSYGGTSLHKQSHGESFLSLFLNRFRGKSLFILDEPEAALSPTRLLSFLQRMHELSMDESQFIIATHSPILLAYPGSTIYQLSEEGYESVGYQETSHFQLTKSFLNDPDRFLAKLFDNQ